MYFSSIKSSIVFKKSEKHTNRKKEKERIEKCESEITDKRWRMQRKGKKQ